MHAVSSMPIDFTVQLPSTGGNGTGIGSGIGMLGAAVGVHWTSRANRLPRRPQRFGGGRRGEGACRGARAEAAPGDGVLLLRRRDRTIDDEGDYGPNLNAESEDILFFPSDIP